MSFEAGVLKMRNKQLYIIRHCEAEGQAPESKLSNKGLSQADSLADFLFTRGISKIVSSPYLRAVESIKPLSKRLSVPIETDNNLKERVLSREPISNWYSVLRNSFSDFNLKIPGAESNNMAMQRGIKAINKILLSPEHVTAVVTHGNLLILLLKFFDQKYGFEDWEALTNPDIYNISLEETRTVVKRIWS